MNPLNLPYRVPLQIVVEVFREEGLRLKWISRPQHSKATVINFPKAHQEYLL